MTPQGRAMQAATLRFGNGATLPFTPCKKGYKPFAGDAKMYACPLHNAERKRRVEKEGFRKGEVDLNTFWKRYSRSTLDKKVNLSSTSGPESASKKQKRC